MPGLTADILRALNREVLNDLDLAKSIEHPGESGRAREQIIARFLRRLLPDAYGISTGFVIDAVGGISRQIDLIIYRTDYHPVFRIGGIDHFMVESVAAIIENKASIGTRKRLRDALENIRSVKILDRTNVGKNYTVVGTKYGSMVDANAFQQQVFGAIVTERSLSKPALARELLTFLRAHPRRDWPNLYIDSRRWSVSYLDTGPKRTSEPTETLRFDRTLDPEYPPLLDLSFEILNFLRVAPLVDYSAVDYLASDVGGPVDLWPI